MTVATIKESEESILETIKGCFYHQSKVLGRLAVNAQVHNYAKALDLIINNKGTNIISGMGKSGIIGNKIAATFSSIGSPSESLHPGDAYHGDLGKIKRGDVCILISNSGETDELLKLLYVIKNFGNPIIAITANADSTLANNADVTLPYELDRESCPMGLAPTASTTATLVIGDALACALVKTRAFTPVNFAKFHPGGSLGRSLLNKVKDEMAIRDLPIVHAEQTIMEAMYTMTNSRIGGIAIVTSNDELVGCFTDGDLRRAATEATPFQTKLSEVVKEGCITVDADESLANADAIITDQNIKQLVVTKLGKVVGLYQRQVH